MDDCTAISSAYFIFHKMKFVDCLRAYKALAGNELIKKERLCTIQLDDANDQMNSNGSIVFNENGTKLEYSTPTQFSLAVHQSG